MNDWQSLITSSSGGVPVTFRVVYRAGVARLFLPVEPKPAGIGLEMYPAQKAGVRMAVGLLKVWIRAGLPAPLPNTTILVGQNAPLIRFLARVAGRTDLPVFAVLAGNPESAGRRFMLLVFDAAERPVAVLKLGIGADAAALVKAEADVLNRIHGREGVPASIDLLNESDLAALALPYVSGRTPKSADKAEVLKMCEHWIAQEAELFLEKIPAWQRLLASAGPQFQSVHERIGNAIVKPVISHGDFAPWNVRGTPGNWTAIDWERGEACGIPGWDLFHYVIQPAILVKGMGADVVLRRVTEFLDGEIFRRYAIKAGIQEIRRELLWAYLLYQVHVIKPVEGGEVLRKMLKPES